MSDDRLAARGDELRKELQYEKAAAEPRKYQIALLVETDTPLMGKDMLDTIEEALTGVGVRPIAAQAREITPATNKEEPHGG